MSGDTKANRQRPSAHGRALGAALARLADEQAATHPEMRERCGSCAFRAGTIPNQMAGTLKDALDCTAGIDPDPFYCHQNLDANGEPTAICAGYLLVKDAPISRFADELEKAAREIDAMTEAGHDA